MPVRRVYLDYNASAPLRSEAREAMLGALDFRGNASSVHAEGRRARAIVDNAREQVAALVRAKPEEVVFTSGATEANNAAVAAGWDVVALSEIEHESVLAPARASGASVTAIPAGAEGVVSLDDIAAGLARMAPPRGRALLALQMANNETGVLQSVAGAAARARDYGFHVFTDAVQAAGRVAIDFKALDVDALSLSSHKLGGPQGAGALVLRDGFAPRAFITGGGQERRRRAGTENVAAIAGFGAAAKAAVSDLARMEALRARRDALERGVRELTPEAIVIGSGAPRLANTSCVSWPGKRAETLVIRFDLAGVAVSAGAACSSGKVGPSHVLAAMGLGSGIAAPAIRVSLGWDTDDEDIAAFLAAWRSIAARPAARGAAA